MKQGIYSFSIILFLFIVIASFQKVQPENKAINMQVNTNGATYDITSISAATVELLLESMSPRERIAQLFFAPVYGRYMAQGSQERLEIERLVVGEHIGGLIMMSGDIYGQAILINDLQNMSKIPLWITQDMEFGAAMRIQGSTRITPAMGIAASGDKRNAFIKGKITASEAKALGVHQIFAPVLDVNNNPNNPAINIRSFSSDPKTVADFGLAFIQGIQSVGLVATAKHFPGHGDTETDSHLDLPVVQHSYDRLDSVELVPFISAVKGGVRSIMSAHISFPNVSNIDGIPGTLDKNILTDILRDSLGFKDMIVTDGLGMKGITNHYSPGKAVIEALRAGADLMLMSLDITTAIDEVEQALAEGTIDMDRINDSARKLLQWKKDHGLLDAKQPIDIAELSKKIGLPEYKSEAKRIAQESITLLKNEEGILPISAARYPHLLVVNVSDSEIGSPEQSFIQEIRKYHPDVDYSEYDLRTTSNEELRILRQARQSDLIVLGAFTRFRVGQNLQLNATQTNFVRKLLATRTPVVTIIFGNPYLIRSISSSEVQLVAWANTSVQSEAAASALFGARDINGRLSIDIPGKYSFGDGIQQPKSTLYFGDPEDVNSSSAKLQPIDKIIREAIRDSVFPGAVVGIVKDGNLIYNKAFGYFDYDKLQEVRSNTPYDLASITKIMATTTAIMHLVDRGLLSLDDRVGTYIESFNSSEKNMLTVRDLLNHESGLPAFKVYVDTIQDRASIIEAVKNEGLQFKPHERYVYSDLGLIVLAEIIEKISGERIDDYTRKHIFYPIGMSSTTFNPKDMGSWYARSIPPTEIDTIFRKELVQADVHDERAYYMDGVAGHAGLFSNTIDIAKYISFLMNGGFYGGQRYLSEDLIEEFVSAQNSLSGRGLGFDLKSRSGFSSAGTLMSDKSFGHTGFTGTSFWVDPEENLGVILLTNRVHPYRSYGSKISQIRAAVADAAYQATSQ
jgi:beta-N-acetylhexosaminidase